jgi:phage gp29-like protein
LRDWVWGELDKWLERIIRAAWGSVLYGYSALRIVYRPEDGGKSTVGGIADVVDLPFEWFEPQKDGSWKMKQEQGEARPLDVWETEYLYFITRRNPTYRNPYGESLLSRAYWPWFFRHNGWRFWMQFLERFGSPMLLGKSMDPEKMADALLLAVQDAVIAVGNDDEVQAISANGNGEAFKAADEALVRRIQRLILGQTASSGDAQGMSNGQMQENVRADKRNADIRLVSPTVQRVVNALTWLRFGPEAEPPEFVFETDQGLEPDRALRDWRLSLAGVRPTEQYLLRAYDFEQGDFTIEQPSTNGVGGQFSAPFKLATQKKQRFSQDQQQIEDLADAALAQASSPIPVAKVRDAVLASTGPEDLAERLANLYEGHDPAEFRDVLERTLYLGDVMGYVQAQTGVKGG